MSFGFEFPFKIEIVLDDPVVNYRYSVLTINMGMRVLRSRPPMSRPSGVAYADGSRHVVEVVLSVNFFQPARIFLNNQLVPVNSDLSN